MSVGLRHFERQSHEAHVADWRQEFGAGAIALHASPAHGSKKDVVTTGKTAARATNVMGRRHHALLAGCSLAHVRVSFDSDCAKFGLAGHQVYHG